MKSVLSEIIGAVFLALAIFFLVSIAVQNFKIEGPSMEPNLHQGQFLLVSKAAYWFGSPERGDVIIFNSLHNPSQDYVKRVIALPGETIEIRKGYVYIDNARLEEPYIEQISNDSLAPQPVPKGSYFVLGDNRNSSNDSRNWGPVPEENIVGKAWLCLWPMSDWGLAPNYSPILAGEGQNSSFRVTIPKGLTSSSNLWPSYSSSFPSSKR